MAGALEGFAALLADVRLLLRVCDCVALKVREVKEDPRAQLAVQHPAGAHVVGGPGIQRVQGAEFPGGEDGSERRGGGRGGVGEVEMVVQR